MFKEAKILFLFSALAATFIVVLWSCGNNTKISVAPELTYIGLTKDTMNQSSVDEDSTIIRLAFYDVDGDLSEVRNGVIVIDTRDGAIYNTYSFPKLPLQDGDVAEGELSIILPSVCCLFPENIQPCESPPAYPSNDLVVEIYIRDAAGNESNRVRSGVITLLCN